MSDWKIIARLARRSLLALFVSILLVLALYHGSALLKNRQATQLMESKEQTSSLQGRLTRSQADLVNLQAQAGRFRQLSERGLLGAADRAGWVEQLKASVARTGLPLDTLRYTLQEPQALASPAAGAADAAAVNAGPSIHDLDFELKNIHEQDLLSLLHDYRVHVRGLFRVQTCTLSEPNEAGLSARCTLRFFNVPDDKPGQT
jgi:hypothetical protein